MSRILVSCSFDYADEFEVSGFKIFKKKEWKEFKKAVKKEYGDRAFCIYFGTNQEIEFESADDYLDSLGYQKISKKEAKIIEERLGKEFGSTNLLDFI